MTQADKIPQEIRLQQDRRVLTLVYVDGAKSLPAEYLRVYSPSAEVRGHGAGQDVLQTGKAEVSITDLDPVGQYALKITFSDGHDSGLYDWGYLYRLAHNQDALWQDYLDRLEKAGASRTPSAEDLKPKRTHSCGSGGCEETAGRVFHSTVSDAAKLILQANVKQLYLTHISTRYTEEEQRLMLERQAQTIFPASKVVGDFDVFDI